MPSTHQTIVINAPINEIWNKFSDFHDLSFAPDVITDLEKVGSIDGHNSGAKRILNHAFHETLIEADSNMHMLKYSIDDGPSPISKDEVSNYVGTVKMSSNGDGTLVEWDSTWDASEENAVEFCHGIYVALLNGLSDSFKH
jgi:Polyketide cyclase / dehydrase and lipid transport